MSNRFVVVDLETTGNSPKKGDRIIQFAAVVVEDGKIVDEFSSLVNPEQQIPVFIEELTGLTDELVEGAPLFSEIAPKVLSMLDGAYFVAHNVLFDLSFLQDELIENGYEGFFGPVLDTVELSRILIPTADSYKLNELALREGLNHERPHQADSDAYVTAELLIRLLKRLLELPRTTLRQLLRFSGGLKSDIALLLDEIVLENESKVEKNPQSLAIHRGIAIKKIEKPHQKYNELIPYPFNDDEKEEYFLKAFPSYEKRMGQFEMMDTVFQSFIEKNHALIEAGTGVGKSIAYLFPAALYAKQEHERVVVSTFTIQLQSQLLAKDIPLLQKMLPFKINTVLLKGRSHYISLAKFEASLKEDDDNYDICLTKMQILVWLTETETGDRDELNLSSGGALFWNKIRNDDLTFFQQKTWNSYDFYLRARKEAENADIIITNHSLLLSDIAAKNTILPTYKYCVIDEAHHFEKAASKHFGDFLDYKDIRILLSQFGQYEQKQLFYKLDKLLKKKNPELEADNLHSFEINQLFQDLTNEMDDFFKIVGLYARKKVKKDSINRITCRLLYDEDSKEWQAAANSGERFYFLLKDVMQYLRDGLELLKLPEITLTAKEKRLLGELSALQKEMEELKDKFKNIILTPPNDFAAWIEVDLRSLQNATRVFSQPVTTAKTMEEQFFAKMDSVILTSATLSVKNSFKYMIDSLGLKNSPIISKQIQSPFQYEEQVQLIIPNDLPEVNSVPLDEYVACITEHIISIAEATKGRMLILFTAYEMLRKTYDLMKESGLLEDYVIIGQGVTSGSRTRLTRNFQRFEKSILLGTNSFWEGIDIPGEDLSCLIIVRLPFSPPNDPLTDAKCELIKQRGGNPFSEYSLPEAIIRFKQGFGRLIRTSQDRGLVVVFDKRLESTSYGKSFLKSIPEVPVKKTNITEIVKFIEDWL
ncbi:ATP-dependent DNA helicase DinG [Bacillus dakarensis]|uniref:ATP-dependent DNA helicase DinG n=1 Tax=Robertmurraya dakarensis TaxID=1926278 RepID=UPI00098211B5|nr:ATP-dependent DNA helicase DinG [Bacillus dakarensis]